MAEFAFVPFYPSDWLAGTRVLTAAETGVYITLVAMMYERQEPIDMPISRLARLCGTKPSAMKAALATLTDEGKIEQTDAGLWNAKVGEVLASVRAKSAKAKASAALRWQDGETTGIPQTTPNGVTPNDKSGGRNPPEKSNENNGGVYANAMPTQCERNAIKSQTKSSSSSSSARGEFSADDLHAEVMKAVGLDDGRIPTYWLPPAATMHVTKWRDDLGLTPDEIIETARNRRAMHDSPPNGPRALDHAMQALAGTKQGPKLKPTSDKKRSAAQPHYKSVLAKKEKAG
jgi:uncharacterized protein YdaU (DUF1376 family)